VDLSFHGQEQAAGHGPGAALHDRAFRGAGAGRAEARRSRLDGIDPIEHRRKARVAALEFTILTVARTGGTGRPRRRGLEQGLLRGPLSEGRAGLSSAVQFGLR
jgi:hypothetical protein